MKEKIPKIVKTLYDLIIRQNSSGCLKITDSRHKSVSWELYYQDNYICYITTNIGQKERLGCLCKYFISKFSPPTLPFNIGEYESIISWWESKKLPLYKLKTLIFNLTEEALSQILTIEDAIIEFSDDKQIVSPITQFSWESIIDIAYAKSKLWRKFYPNHLSAFHRLYLDSNKTYQFYRFWKSQKNLEQTKSPRISFWLLNLAKKKSIYQLSQERGILPLTFVEDFQHLLQTNTIDVLPFCKKNTEIYNKSKVLFDNQEIKSSTNFFPIIACIDDSQTVQKYIQKTLEIIGYQTLSLTDPTLCLTTLEIYHPKLIFMDINMPQVNGYELCGMLQKSKKLREIPVVILTGRDKLVDRLRAKILGVEHYLTKPCKPQEVLSIVQQLTAKKSVKSSGIPDVKPT